MRICAELLCQILPIFKLCPLMEPICLFPVSGIILRTCFRLFADSDVAFVFLADKLARFCHHIGKALPKAWQNFAKGMAKLCQYGGKTLAK